MNEIKAKALECAISTLAALPDNIKAACLDEDTYQETAITNFVKSLAILYEEYLQDTAE
ncbi:MAG TPA: hypothetical protein IAA30_08095 [Candidatus Treponema faecavium]|nr:hypothetical protein [Candidatus Treponema faecavium]